MNTQKELNVREGLKQLPKPRQQRYNAIPHDFVCDNLSFARSWNHAGVCSFADRANTDEATAASVQYRW